MGFCCSSPISNYHTISLHLLPLASHWKTFKVKSHKSNLTRFSLHFISYISGFVSLLLQQQFVTNIFLPEWHTESHTPTLFQTPYNCGFVERPHWVVEPKGLPFKFGMQCATSITNTGKWGCKKQTKQQERPKKSRRRQSQLCFISNSWKRAVSASSSRSSSVCISAKVVKYVLTVLFFCCWFCLIWWEEVPCILCILMIWESLPAKTLISLASVSADKTIS